MHGEDEEKPPNPLGTRGNEEKGRRHSHGSGNPSSNTNTYLFLMRSNTNGLYTI